jgi:dipeptide/tripeptide permease
MLTVLLGAVLMFCGLLLLAAKPIFGGRFSSARRSSEATPEPSLEPPKPGAGFSLMESWPGLGLIVLGGILLLVG